MSLDKPFELKNAVQSMNFIGELHQTQLRSTYNGHPVYFADKESLVFGDQFYFSIGDICVCEDKLYIFTAVNGWELLSDNPKEPVYEKEVEEIFYQCRNCGAPTRENGICNYCGTINRKARKFHA